MTGKITRAPMSCGYSFSTMIRCVKEALLGCFRTRRVTYQPNPQAAYETEIPNLPVAQVVDLPLRQVRVRELQALQSIPQPASRSTLLDQVNDAKALLDYPRTSLLCDPSRFSGDDVTTTIHQGVHQILLRVQLAGKACAEIACSDNRIDDRIRVKIGEIISLTAFVAEQYETGYKKLAIRDIGKMGMFANSFRNSLCRVKYNLDIIEDIINGRGEDLCFLPLEFINYNLHGAGNVAPNAQTVPAVECSAMHQRVGLPPQALHASDETDVEDPTNFMTVSLTPHPVGRDFEVRDAQPAYYHLDGAVERNGLRPS